MRVLTPYRGVRYHLKEFDPTLGNRPQNREELFNLRHAQLRNIIERSFGLLKERFQLLSRPIDMADGHEIWKVVYSCVAMHNFIRIEGASVDNAILVNLIRKECNFFFPSSYN